MPDPYIPRLSDAGMRGNPYWYSRNPFYIAGFGLPNCTCYAWGRFWENSDINRDYTNPPTLSTANAEDWYNYNDGYQRGSTPQLGAVLCLADGPYSGDGHVAIVEEIDVNTGAITVSQSAWGGGYFYTSVLYPPHYLPIAGYVFQGFIYNPNSGGSWIPPYYWKKPWLYTRKWLKKKDSGLWL